MPGFPFLLDEKSWQRVQTRFEIELALWAANDASHLMAIATFGMNAAGLAIVEEIALMAVAEHWVPYKSAHEQRLVEALAKRGTEHQGVTLRGAGRAADRRRAPDAASAAAGRLLVVQAGADDAYDAALEELIASRPRWTAGSGGPHMATCRPCRRADARRQQASSRPRRGSYAYAEDRREVLGDCEYNRPAFVSSARHNWIALKPDTSGVGNGPRPEASRRGCLGLR